MPFRSGFVCILGRPNAGKSTMLNALVGEKLAIISPKPQTTRNRILGVRNYADAQVVFIDTPGIHRPLHRMNVRMVSAAVETIREVDVLGLVVDASERRGHGDRYVFDLVKSVSVPVFLILNKIDTMKKVKLLPIMDEVSKLGNFAAIIPVSAFTGDNVDRLERAGKLKPRVAAWIRQNPKASSGWMWIIVGCSFLFLAFARLWG